MLLPKIGGIFLCAPKIDWSSFSGCSGLYCFRFPLSLSIAISTAFCQLSAESSFAFGSFGSFGQQDPPWKQYRQWKIPISFDDFTSISQHFPAINVHWVPMFRDFPVPPAILSPAHVDVQDLPRPAAEAPWQLNNWFLSSILKRELCSSGRTPLRHLFPIQASTVTRNKPSASWSQNDKIGVAYLSKQLCSNESCKIKTLLLSKLLRLRHFFLGEIQKME